MQPLDWKSNQSYIFANPQLEKAFYPSNWDGYKNYPAHIWIATSGTTQSAGGAIKWVALSKKAFLASAEAVNAHLKSNSSDTWLNCLPLFHVGGLSIYARAYLSSAKVETIHLPKWCKESFMELLPKATLTSLVPAQLFDIISANYLAPPNLRGVIIGGGVLPLELFEKALSLNWPLMPSFGMTECSSQIATAHDGSYDLTILPHMKCSVTTDGLLQIKSPALFSGYLHVQEGSFHFHDPKEDGIFTTQDLVEIENGIIRPLGRASDFIKIGGENASLFHLETFFNKIKPGHLDAFLNAADDKRLGKIIELVTLKAHAHEVVSLIQAFNGGVMPFEKIRHTRFVESIPRTELGKVIKSKF